jgi:carbon monoxide dehydrogenase subunit G
VTITTRFQVDAPIETVWQSMLDVRLVAGCVPGAELTELIDERTFTGKLGVKLGPIEVAYRGRLHLDEIDEASHRVRMRADGSEARGRGGAAATITTQLLSAEGKTAVDMQSDVAVTGIVAQFGRTAIMQEVANRMAERFARCLEQKLKAGRPA